VRGLYKAQWTYKQRNKLLLGSDDNVLLYFRQRIYSVLLLETKTQSDYHNITKPVLNNNA